MLELYQQDAYEDISNLTKNIMEQNIRTMDNDIKITDTDIKTADTDNKIIDNDVDSIECPCCMGKTKERTSLERKDLMNRLRRIEGQVRGIEGMLEKDAYCVDILVQVQAVTSALNSFNKVLLAEHVKTCVADNIRKGNDEVIDELVSTLQKLMK